jgi:hypothetical protein
VEFIAPAPAEMNCTPSSGDLKRRYRCSRIPDEPINSDINPRKGSTRDHSSRAATSSMNASMSAPDPPLCDLQYTGLVGLRRSLASPRADWTSSRMVNSASLSTVSSTALETTWQGPWRLRCSSLAVSGFERDCLLACCLLLASSSNMRSGRSRRGSRRRRKSVEQCLGRATWTKCVKFADVRTNFLFLERGSSRRQ